MTGAKQWVQHVSTMKAVPNFASFWLFYEVWERQIILHTVSSKKQRDKVWIAVAAVAAARAGWFQVAVVNLHEVVM